MSRGLRTPRGRPDRPGRPTRVTRPGVRRGAVRNSRRGPTTRPSGSTTVGAAITDTRRGCTWPGPGLGSVLLDTTHSLPQSRTTFVSSPSFDLHLRP